MTEAFNLASVVLAILLPVVYLMDFKATYAQALTYIQLGTAGGHVFLLF